MLGMKFAVRQNTIEDALKAHFKDQMNLPVGSDLHIEFRATRGEGGFTANIEVVDENFVAPTKTKAPGTTATGAPRKKPGPKPKTAKPVGAAFAPGEQPAEVTPELREAAKSNDPGISVQDAQRIAADPANATETVSGETTEEAPETVTEAVTGVPATPVATETRGSLFGNLGRPKNEPSE